jgi:pre-mRNA cleavage complex 2 protein Pcf11
MSGLVSDEVAEDYKSSLEDLTGNDRFQISNLTVIAKENTEHAMAISRVLENHIRSVGALLSWRLFRLSLSSVLVDWNF